MSQNVKHQLEDLTDILQTIGRQQLLLVIDQPAYVASGAEERLRAVFADYEVRVFSQLDSNPKLPHAARGALVLQAMADAAVLAIGGGSTIDMAKLICAGSCSFPNSISTESERCTLPSIVNPRKHPLIAVPTTAGTGSEATQFAVVYVEGVKHSVTHPSLLPDVVVLDATLTESLPREVTTASGLDAVVQAVESLWAVQATDESRSLAELALRLGLEHLDRAVHRPTPDDRAAMLTAANLSGQAINVSRTTAAHAMSYTLTIEHGIPHGLAVAMCLGPLLRFNGRATAESTVHPGGLALLRQIQHTICDAFAVPTTHSVPLDSVASRWEQLLVRLECPVRLHEYGITDPTSLQRIATSVNQERLANNPRLTTKQNLQRFVAQIA